MEQHFGHRRRGSGTQIRLGPFQCRPSADGHEAVYVPQLVDSHVLQTTLLSPSAPTEQATDHNTLVFRLNVKCERNKAAPKGSTDDNELYINHEVLSSHLEWQPQEEQGVVFADSPPAPSNPNIVLAKLRPGQEIDLELHAIKGVGKDHAKFTPVGKLNPPLFF